MFKSIVFMPIVFEYIKDTFLFQISGILGVGTTDLAFESNDSGRKMLTGLMFYDIFLI